MSTVIKAAAKFQKKKKKGKPIEEKVFYTSNYENSGDSPLAVCVSHPSDTPDTYTGARAEDLAPSAEMLEKYHGRDSKKGHAAYAQEYLALLGSRGLSASKIAARYPNGTIFICYDYDEAKDTSVCHRLILSELLSATGLANMTPMAVVKY